MPLDIQFLFDHLKLVRILEFLEAVFGCFLLFEGNEGEVLIGVFILFDY